VDESDQLFPFHCSTTPYKIDADVPMATQLVVFEQDTPPSTDPKPRSGLAMTDQSPLPPQCSITLLFEYPTAKQLVGLGHDTPPSAVSLVGFGVPSMVDQLPRPFQCSTTLFTAKPPRNESYLPTAKQLFALGHDTDPNEASFGGLRFIMNDQRLPFQCSTNGLIPPPSEKPTAKQLVSLGHDTPAS